MGVVDELVRGREAFERRAWATAYVALSAIAPAALSDADLSALATSAYLAGDHQNAVRAWQRAFDLHIAASEIRLAVRDAHWLAFASAVGGNTSTASGWTARAERLLQTQPDDVVERGYLGLLHFQRCLAMGDFGAVEEGHWQARSHRPEHCPHHTPPEVEKAVLDQRRALGRDNGADNIAYHLECIATEQHWSDKGWRVPSRATINKILRRNHAVEAQPQKRPKSSYRRFAYARPRDCYQIDATEVGLLGGEKATVFEVLDDCARTLVATHVADAETAIGAITAIRAAFTDYGVPAIVLADNGSAFTSRLTKGGTSRFTRVVTSHRARLIHSSPYHPQTCGKVERHHRTFKEWLTDQPTQPRTRRQLQDLCDQYQQYYNTDRRHSAWNKPPLQAWKDIPTHGGPSELPLQQDATARTLLVSTAGRINIHGTRITIGRQYRGQRLTLVTDGDHVTAYQPDGQPLGHLHVDATTPASESRLVAA